MGFGTCKLADALVHLSFSVSANFQTYLRDGSHILLLLESPNAVSESRQSKQV